MLSFALLAGAIFVTVLCAIQSAKVVVRFARDDGEDMYKHSVDIAALIAISAALLWAAWATWGQHV